MLKPGESVQVQGSAAKPYVVKNHDGVIWSCGCQGWKMSPGAVSEKICKHVRQVKGSSFVQTGTTTGRVQTAAPNPGAKLRPDEKAKLNGPKLLLAHNWDGVLDPTGYLLSHKLDGVRALFRDGKFISRQGNIFKAPDFFHTDLPDCELDGELFVGPSKFSETISIVKSHDSGNRWKGVHFAVFDAPQHGGKFEDRYAALQILLKNCEYAYALKHEVCRGVNHLKQELALVEAGGGEGLMLRQPGSLYEVGRSHTLLKCKTFHDMDGLVVGHSPGRGKYKGMTGALECVLPNGVEFSVGSGLTDALRRNPPSIGTKIVVQYFELMKDTGAPRFPTFLRVRPDE